MMIIAGALVASTPAVAQTAPAQNGTYAGGFLGFSATSPHYSEPGAAGLYNPSLEGIAGGVFVGYGAKVGNLKVGVEADWGLLDNERDNDSKNSYTDYTAFTTKWNGHVRARVGADVEGATLFAAAGLAAMRFVTDDTDTDYDSFAHTYTGLSIGGGAEKTIGGNAFVRAEYLHDAFGSTKGNIAFKGTPSYDVTVKPNTDTVRIGLGLNF